VIDNSQDRTGNLRGTGSRGFFACFLIVAGSLLFLGNLGILPIRHVWSYWPLLIVGLGISKVLNSSDIVHRLFGAMVAFLGTIFLLVNLDVIHIRANDGSWPISILLIAFGMAMLLKTLHRRDPGEPLWGNFHRPVPGDGVNTLSDMSILGAIKRRVESPQFRGGHALSVLGSVELDLRHAGLLPGQTAYLEVSAILGSAKIRVPSSWRIQIHGTGIMGTYEDKTVPTMIGPDSPILIITGSSFMSAVEIED
jgi:predicted membrane protein